MRMPYIGGRGPDYTTKLNLMYNWRGAFRGGGVAGDDSWTGRERGGDAETGLAGDGAACTHSGAGAGRERHECVETREAGEGLGRALRAVRKVIDIPRVGDSREVIRRVQTPTSTPTIQTLPASANLPRKVTPRDKSRGRLLEARGNRSPPRSESL